jgi:hypothetical protein
MPVLADVTGPLPGRPLLAWPPTAAGEEFRPPQGRGVRRFAPDSRHGRCPICGRLDERSAVGVLDGLLAPYRASRQ